MPCSRQLDIFEHPLILSEIPRRTTITWAVLQPLLHKLQELHLLLPVKAGLSVLKWNVVWLAESGEYIT